MKKILLKNTIYTLFTISISLTTQAYRGGSAPNQKLQRVQNEILIENQMKYEDQKAWLKTQESLDKIDIDKIIGIEIVTAGSDQSNMMSQWGHSMIRFVGQNQNPSDDIVIGFVAKLEGQSAVQMMSKDLNSFDRAFAMLGVSSGFLLGSYPIIVNAAPFFDYVDQYVNTEERSMHRLIIPSTSEQRVRILNFVKKVHLQKLKYKYTLLNKNCASMIELAFNYAGIQSKNIELVNTEKYVPTSLHEYAVAAL